MKKRFDRLSMTAQMMILAQGGLFCVLLVLGILVYLLLFPFERPIPYILGLTLGMALGVVRIGLMEKSIHRSLDMEAEKAKSFSSMHALLRNLLVVAAAAVVVALRGRVGVFGFILGLLSLQLSAYIANGFLKHKTDI